jgi:hypothetical protein
MQREHGDFLMLAVRARQLAVLAVVQRPVGRIPLLNDLQALMDLVTQLREAK